LLITIKNLQAKYLSEADSHKISYSMFCKLTPFWVDFAKESDRETCQCKVHENAEFMLNKLQAEYIAPKTTSLECTIESGLQSDEQKLHVWTAQ